MTDKQIETLKANLSTKLATSEEGKISNTSTISYYIVAKGDSLWGIAKKQLGDGTRYIEIYKLNQNIVKRPNMIKIGQKLILTVR